MIAFAKLNKHSLVCIRENKIYSVKKRDILDKKVKINNLQVVNGKICGKRFLIDYLPEFKTDSNRVTIIKVKLTNDGQAVLGYYYINSFGKVMYAEKDDLKTFRKLSILNGSIDKGIVNVNNIECLMVEKAFKGVSYSVDEYYDLFNKYKNNNLITNDNKKVSSTVEAFGRLQEYSANAFENFMNFHKQVYGLVSKANIIRAVKVFDINKLDKDNNIEDKGNKECMYVVTFSYNGNIKSILIPSFDKKMVHLVKYKIKDIIAGNTDDIRNLVYDNESSDSTISGKAFVEKTELEKELDKLDNGLILTREIEIKSGKIELLTGEFKIRRNILIGSSDFRLMLAV